MSRGVERVARFAARTNQLIPSQRPPAATSSRVGEERGQSADTDAEPDVSAHHVNLRC
jgi:hypothetical protein